ncbi:hypothetical protein D3C78_1262800 [compost metagenome]
MTRDELIAEFRVMTRDLVEDYLWQTAWVARWIDQAEAEACLRGRLLYESGDPMLCEIAVAPGVAHYLLHPALYELAHVAWRASGANRREPVKLVSTEWLDDRVRDWRDLAGAPEYVVQGDTGLRLVPQPDADGVLLLEGYRLPVRSVAASGSSTPEIHPAHHIHLLQWVLYRAYSHPDTETLNPGKAAEAERAFSAYFGERPDSDLRRITREDVDHHNKAWV